MHSGHRRSFPKTGTAFGLVAGLGGVGALGAWATSSAAARIKPAANAALIEVDVQNCFIDGGTLPVKGRAEVVPVISKLADAFQTIMLTRDWHTPGHASFASSYQGKKPFEATKLSYGTQVLWPDHCVQGTDDAAPDKDLKLPTAQLIIRWTAMDARKAGFDTYLIEDATRAIDPHGSPAAAWEQMQPKGVKRIQSADIA